MIFEDRTDAGRQLARTLISYKGRDPVVYALPRGGVVVGAEIARFLDATLDLVITRKIGHPILSEYAIAAVGEDGDTVTNPTEIASVDRRWFKQEVSIQQREAQRRRWMYMGDRKPVPARNKVAIIVDDGLATGLTMCAALQDVRRRGPRRIVVAVPVAPPDTVRKLKLLADEVVVLYSPEDFMSIGSFYARFDQVSDSEVIEILNSWIPSLVE
jgi:predicted phosphoribosyltransferase